jgi:hypothetical protein
MGCPFAKGGTGHDVTFGAWSAINRDERPESVAGGRAPGLRVQ